MYNQIIGHGPTHKRSPTYKIVVLGVVNCSNNFNKSIKKSISLSYVVYFRLHSYPRSVHAHMSQYRNMIKMYMWNFFVDVLPYHLYFASGFTNVLFLFIRKIFTAVSCRRSSIYFKMFLKRQITTSSIKRRD